MAELRQVNLLRGFHGKNCCLCVAQGDGILNAVIRDVEYRISKVFFTFKVWRSFALHA